MYTSMLGLAVSALLGSATPHFETEYREAKALAAREQKPLIIVLGAGETAWSGIVTDGGPDVEALKSMHDSYVCIYVDTETDKGHRLAADFEFHNTPACIISDKTGELQAYRHEGPVTAATFSAVLRQYADPNRVIARTDSNQPNTSNYAPPVQQQCLT